MSIYNKRGRDGMDIIVSNMDSTPIYEQITRQIKAKILGGERYMG